MMNHYVSAASHVGMYLWYSVSVGIYIFSSYVFVDMDDVFKARIVQLILDGRVEEALALLSNYFGIPPPRIKVGRVKGRKRALAVYVPKEKTIYVQYGDLYTNPHVILHEFYHHLRFRDGRHRGTEKHADRFAEEFIKAYLRIKSGKGGDT